MENDTTAAPGSHPTQGRAAKKPKVKVAPAGWEAPVTALTRGIGAVTAAFAAVITAIAGLNISSGLVRGSERAVLGAVGLVIIALGMLFFTDRETLGRRPKMRQLFIGVAGLLVLSAVMLVAYVPLKSVARDYRPRIDLTTQGTGRTVHLTGTVSVANLVPGERIAALVLVERQGDQPPTELLRASSGSDTDGNGKIAFDLVTPPVEQGSITVLAWLPDRSSSDPTCTDAFTPTIAPFPDVAAWLKSRDSWPYVACAKVEIPEVADAGPQVRLEPAATGRAATLTVKDEVGEAQVVLVRVVDTANRQHPIYSTVAYPSDSGVVELSASIPLDTGVQSLCAVAVVADANQALVAPTLTDTCRPSDPGADGKQTVQFGATELVIPAVPTPSPSASASAAASATPGN